MSKDYNPSAIEAKWQKKWEEEGVYKTDLKNAKNPFFTHVMFPYPSGDKLHVGHWYNFAPADSYARFKRMQGYDVFEPMGFDAFGLPAENYAVKTGIHPSESIHDNVQTMITQLKRIGCMYDWDKMVNTSTPEYYQWTQWIFLQMFQNDLAYRKEATVNFCPCCQTVLANEQVHEGHCDRCDSDVVQKSMTQWFWKITNYAQRLLDNLEGLDWPEKTKTMQRNWIGRSDGAEANFQIDGHDAMVTVFTTRPDTLFGSTYMVLSPEHPLVDVITTDGQKKEVTTYQEKTKNKTELQRTDLAKEKTGVFTGAYAINPVNDEKIPVWIADYVLMNYGTGAIMAVPAHDERDWEFAKKFGLPLVEVVQGGDIAKEAFIGEGEAMNSDFLDGLQTSDAKKKIIAWLAKEKKGKGVINYRLRDWLISRQRYWGAPIPIVYDPDGNPHPIPEEHLPWLLPTDVEFKPTGTAPLAQSKELKERTEKIFGKGWTPEVDTMDTFVCSSFYSLRYLAEGSAEKFVAKAIEKKWMPVDMYIGGAEHACMHLIYTRFVGMVLKDLKHIDHEEQYQRLVHQGVITSQGAKMSKSKGNVVSPDEFVEYYGSDVFRMYLMFMGPFTDGGDWSDTGIKGVDRFAKRIWRLFTERLSKDLDQVSAPIQAKLHWATKKITEDIERLHFNTALSALMELLNLLEGEEALTVDTAQTVSRLLAPLAPHLAEELWGLSGGEGFVVSQPWPAYDESLLVSDTVTIAVQVSGKLRADFVASADITETDAIATAKQQPNVAKFLEGKEIKKEIYVQGKLVSFVVS